MKLTGIAIVGMIFCGLSTGQEGGPRNPIYPFDVTVGEELAKLEGTGGAAIFARAKTPVKNDAVVKLGIEPDMVIVNIFATNEKGETPSGAQPQPAVIMNSKTTSFSLDATMDQRKLEPGYYLMNIVAQKLGTSRVVFQVGDGKGAQSTTTPAPATTSPGSTPAGGAMTTAIDQSRPEAVLQAVFDAAKSGNAVPLKTLEGQGSDGDVKQVCRVSDAGEEGIAMLKSYFEKGKIVGEAKIQGDNASIDFLFGPDGTKSETMNLIKVGDKWFLYSF